jgi:hypothetical protein
MMDSTMICEKENGKKVPEPRTNTFLMVGIDLAGLVDRSLRRRKRREKSIHDIVSTHHSALMTAVELLVE